MLLEYELKLTFTDAEDRIDSIIIERVDGNIVRPESFASTLTRAVSMRASRMDFSPFTNTTSAATNINSSISNGGGLSSRGQTGGVSGGVGGGSISTPRGPESRERKLSVSIQKPPPPSTPRNPTTTSTSSKHSPRTIPPTSPLATYGHTLIKECSSDWTCRFCHIHNMPEALKKSMCILYYNIILYTIYIPHIHTILYTLFSF